MAKKTSGVSGADINNILDKDYSDLKNIKRQY